MTHSARAAQVKDLAVGRPLGLAVAAGAHVVVEKLGYQAEALLLGVPPADVKLGAYPGLLALTVLGEPGVGYGWLDQAPPRTRAGTRWASASE